MIVVALYHHHKLLLRGLAVAFLCEVTWIIIIFMMFFLRLASIGNACNFGDMRNAKLYILLITWVTQFCVLFRPWDIDDLSA
jgi:hypothetical protein